MLEEWGEGFPVPRFLMYASSKHLQDRCYLALELAMVNKQVFGQYSLRMTIFQKTIKEAVSKT